MKHFRKFLNNSHVFHVDDVNKHIYDLIDNSDSEVYVRIDTYNWSILENEHFNIDTEEKMDAIFDKVAEFIDEQNRVEKFDGVENYGLYNEYY
jgi:hypothetical protein